MRVEDLFENVTADLIAAIEAGASAWRMPWHSLTGLPRNLDGRTYRGLNALVLGLTAAAHDWSGVYGTYRSIQQRGGQVRRGEHGTTVVLWKPVVRHATDDNDNDNDDSDETSGARRGLVARTYTVFAVEQVDGITIPTPGGLDPATRLDDADRYFARVGADVRIGGDRACYEPVADVIRLPAYEQFDRPADFYATQAHEQVHRTGHRSRLGRDLSGRFGDHAYAAEEPVAELGAAFWCAQFGLTQATRDDHAAYLAGWLAILRADARALVAVCGHAQRAVDLLNTLAGWALTPEV